MFQGRGFNRNNFKLSLYLVEPIWRTTENGTAALSRQQTTPKYLPTSSQPAEETSLDDLADDSIDSYTPNYDSPGDADNDEILAEKKVDTLDPKPSSSQKCDDIVTDAIIFNILFRNLFFYTAPLRGRPLAVSDWKGVEQTQKIA